MKIVIFGAAGKTGLPILDQALAARHTVTAELQKGLATREFVRFHFIK